MVSSITVTVLGCSGSYAAPGEACTGYLVQSAGTNVLLDLGPGTLANLQRHLPVEHLDAVVATHCHPDHWVELPVLRTVCQWFVERPILPVYSTADVRAMSTTITGDDSEAFEWHVVTGGMQVDIGGQRWRFSITDHPVETLAVRVDVGDRSFAFTSDTGPGWSVGAFGEGVDLVLSEASYTSEREPEGIQHLSARQAGLLARQAGAKRLVLTHQMPGADVESHRAEGSEAFGAEVDVASTGAVFRI